MERDNLQEHENQGISRRDLLKKGAALGGTVMWVTPAVQTLGMGRAFASIVSPEPTDISYIAFWWNCGDGWYFTKNEDDGSSGGTWEPDPGATPGCDLPDDSISDPIKVDGSDYFETTWDDGCVEVTVDLDDECEVFYAAKGGKDRCQTGELEPGSTITICLDGEQLADEEQLTEEELAEEPSDNLREQLSEDGELTEEGEDLDGSGGEESVSEEDGEISDESGGEESTSGEVSEPEPSDNLREQLSEDEGLTEEDQSQDESGEGESVTEDEGEPSKDLLDTIDEILDEGEK